MRSKLLWMLSFVLVAGPAVSVAFAAGSNKPMYVAAVTTKFGNFPGIPKCTLGAAQSGDPMKGPGVLLLKVATGCKIPWHWHTADEQLMMVSGRAMGEMKDGSPVTLRPGDYLFLPGKGVHQFTCLSACLLFNETSAAFDIHYVDANGKEISVDDALKTKAAATKKAK
jgi:mannose-6-phosphate isomerase-like protein (cupin superfamily)